MNEEQEKMIVDKKTKESSSVPYGEWQYGTREGEGILGLVRRGAATIPLSRLALLKALPRTDRLQGLAQIPAVPGEQARAVLAHAQRAPRADPAPWRSGAARTGAGAAGLAREDVVPVPRGNHGRVACIAGVVSRLQGPRGNGAVGARREGCRVRESVDAAAAAVTEG